VDVIAEYRLHLKYPDGELVPVWLRINRPERLPTGLWECTGVMDGGRWAHPQYGPFVSPIMASTSWQALAFALRFMHQMIAQEVRSGAMLFSESGRNPIHLDELFPLLRDWQRPPE
jgi:hypothetical protein